MVELKGKTKTKKQLAKDLSDFLLIRNISWERLPKRDLVKLHVTFMRLKKDVDSLFQMLEGTPQQLNIEKPHYIV